MFGKTHKFPLMIKSDTYGILLDVELPLFLRKEIADFFVVDLHVGNSQQEFTIIRLDSANYLTISLG